MSYGYPPAGGPGYPPQQQTQGGYPPQGQPGGYPPANTGGYGAPGGYPPAPGGGGYPPAPGGGGYPPAPGAGGYPPAQGGSYGAPPAGGIGFEGVASQPRPPQAPAPNYGYGAPPQGGGYGTYPQGQGGYPAPGAPPPQGGYGTAALPPQGGYGTAPPPQGGNYPPQQYGTAPPVQQPYGQQPQYGQAAPMPTQQQLYGNQQAQPAYSAPPSSSQGVAKVSGAMAAMKIATHGTVKPAAGFNAESDAQILRKAMKGLGTDEKAIINILGFRTNKQRQEIKTMYKQAYGRDLVKDLKSELGSHFEDLVLALMMTPREFDAYCLHDAMAGAGTTESTLIEILVSRSNSELKEIKELYKKKHGDLEKELMSETSGHFRKLLVSLNNAARDESDLVDVAKAHADAEKLYSAGEKKWGTDEAAFNLIMSTRNFAQLRCVFEEYSKIAHRDIIKSIQSEFSGDVEDGMCAVVDIARNPPAYFAKRVYQSVRGAGTNDKMLIRVIVSRSEVDMVEIKKEFHSMFKKELGRMVEGDTSGDYKKLLLAIVGN